LWLDFYADELVIWFIGVLVNPATVITKMDHLTILTSVLLVENEQGTVHKVVSLGQKPLVRKIRVVYYRIHHQQGQFCLR